MTTDKETKKPFIRPNSHLFYNSVIVLSGFLVFIFIPLFFLSPEQTKLFINNGRELQVLMDALFLVACFTFFVGFYYWFFVLIRLKDIAATHIMFLFSWVALSGFLFPLTNEDGMFLLTNAQTHTFNLVVVGIASAVLAILFISRHSKSAQIFMGIFLSIAIVTSLPKAFSKFEKHDKTQNTVELSGEKNLILVGLDGIPGHIFKQVLLSSPEHSAVLKDFTFYENVFASSPATKGSLRGIVHGNHDFTKHQSPIWGADKDLYFNQDEDVHFTTGAGYNYYNKTGTKLTPGQYGKAEQRNELFELYRNVIVRIATQNGVKIVDGMDAFFFPDREGKFYSTVEGFDKTIASMTVDSAKPAIFYSHFTFTHSPIITDENCADRKMDAHWFNEHQNVKGLSGVAQCGLQKYAELIAHLKKLDVYKNSTLILLSDHGQFPSFYSEPPHNLKINNGPHMGFDRYQPFILIKPAHHHADQMDTSSEYILLDDLAQTTCYLFETADVCERSPGRNILDEADIPPDDFYIHVVKDETSGWAVLDHKAVSLPRNIPLIDAMRASPEIILSSDE